MPVIDMIILGFVSLSLTVSLATHDLPAVFSKDLSDMERSARAIELYLQDQKDHSEHCPTIEWQQPALDIYKLALKSQLPEGCKE
jgi:hypothetical protein